jgi:hypothetical protein
MIKILAKSLLLVLLTTLVTVKVAFAYIDPSTGGMLFQALATALAVFAGFALVFSRQIRTFWARLRRSFRGADQAEEEEQQAPPDVDSQDESRT